MTLPNPFTFGALPPTFNSAAASALAAKFSSCINSSGAMGMLDVLTSARSRSKVSGGTKLEDACVSTDGKPIGDDLGDLTDLTKCELFQTGGRYDPTKLKQEQDRIDQMTALMQCKENKFKQVKSQLDCLTVQANQITQQVNALQQVYTQSIHKMQSDVADLASQTKNRQSQIQDINTKLSGDPNGSGTTGLLAAQKATRELVSQMNAKIAALKEEQKKATLQRSSLVERASQRTMGLAADCFSTQTKAEFRCYNSGASDKNPARSAKDYLLCRYRQNQTQVGNGGVVVQNGIQAAVGNQKADELASLLDEIISQSPDSNQTTTDPQKFQQQIDKVVTVMSVADIERIYGSRLKAFDGKGIPVHDYVMKYLGSCFQRATIAVNNERTRTNSSLGQAEEAIKALERQNSTVVRSYMSDIANQYGENMKSLTGDHLPLDISQCNNASPDIQANCLDEAMLNLTAQLSGVKPASNPNTSDYSMNIFIKGNDAKTDITVACAGLDGCVTKLQQYSTALNRETQKIDSFKTDYIGKAFRNTEDFTQQLRQQLSPQSEALRNQLKTLNSALATLGVDELVKIEDVQGEELEQDDQDPNKGLPKMPRNVLALIGSKMSPPLLNVAGNDFSGALGGIGKAANDLKNKEAKLAQFKVRLVPQAEICKKEDLKAPIAEIKAEADQYKSCIPYLCDGENAKGGDLDTLMSDISSVMQYSGTTGMGEVSGILSSGRSDCAQKKDAYKTKKEEKGRELASAKEDVTAAQRVKDQRDQQYEAQLATCQAITDKASDASKQCQQALLQAQTNQDNAAKDLRTAKEKVTTVQTAYNELTSQKGGSDTSNCASIATSMDDKVKKLGQRARDIASDASGAR